jgi:putative ABC transport system permease protein
VGQSRRRLGFTVTVVLTLALSIGATTAIFSLGDAVLLRPLPFLESDRLVAIDTLGSPPRGGTN